jgi:putative tricarboxylic transport membrane protein
MTFSNWTLMRAACAALIALAPLPSVAQDWEPRRPIDFTIMAGPGGGADQIARFIQSVAEEYDMTNRPLVPTTGRRVGRRGADPCQQHLRSRSHDPRDAELVLHHAAAPGNLGIDIQTFTPVAMMGVDPFVLWVHTDSGITDFDQFVEQVQSMDGEFVMGGTGFGPGRLHRHRLHVRRL